MDIQTTQRKYNRRETCIFYTSLFLLFLQYLPWNILNIQPLKSPVTLRTFRSVYVKIIFRFFLWVCSRKKKASQKRNGVSVGYAPTLRKLFEKSFIKNFLYLPPSVSRSRTKRAYHYHRGWQSSYTVSALQRSPLPSVLCLNTVPLQTASASCRER